jgi:hypothetical protein
MHMHSLLVHFYNPVLDKDGVLNKLVAFADPPYCHCELEFADGQSCAVYMAGKVHVKTRQFDPKSYDTVRVQVSAHQHAQAQALALALQTEGQAFSNRAMLASKFAYISVPDTRKFTCCSKLCLDVLHEAGVVPRTIVAARHTPSTLHATLTTLAQKHVGNSTVIDFLPTHSVFIKEVP